MSTALYRRYRPETFADVIGQEHVTEPLIAALEKNRVNHAYLFSGPRGCGKTTSARILARCLNCAQGPTATPCGQCDSCQELSRDGGGSLDVIEMDAASHGGVDHARDLRERATFAPVRDRYKIFIIDEAHMVTREGFNALLKIVEEPPEHIKFIFATTEPNKVLGTIRSRTHHYPFRLIPPQTLHAYLEKLCAEEQVKAEPGVLQLVVRAGAGSARDSLSILDQLIAGAPDSGITYNLAVSLLGYTHTELLDEILNALIGSDAGAVFGAIHRVIQNGQDPRRFVEDLLERFRDLLIIKAVPDAGQSILRGLPKDQVQAMVQQADAMTVAQISRAADITNEALNEMSGAAQPQLNLELLCARILIPAADAGSGALSARMDTLEQRVGAAVSPVQGQDGAPSLAPQATGIAAARQALGTMNDSAQNSEPVQKNDPAQNGGPSTSGVPAQGGTPVQSGRGVAPLAGLVRKNQPEPAAPSVASQPTGGEKEPAAEAQQEDIAQHPGAGSATARPAGQRANQQGQNVVNLVLTNWRDVLAQVPSPTGRQFLADCEPSKFENGSLYIRATIDVLRRAKEHVPALQKALVQVLDLDVPVRAEVLKTSSPQQAGSQQNPQRPPLQQGAPASYQQVGEPRSTEPRRAAQQTTDPQAPSAQQGQESQQRQPHIAEGPRGGETAWAQHGQPRSDSAPQWSTEDWNNPVTSWNVAPIPSEDSQEASPAESESQNAERPIAPESTSEKQQHQAPTGHAPATAQQASDNTNKHKVSDSAPRETSTQPHLRVIQGSGDALEQARANHPSSGQWNRPEIAPVQDREREPARPIAEEYGNYEGGYFDEPDDSENPSPTWEEGAPTGTIEANKQQAPEPVAGEDGAHPAPATTSLATPQQGKAQRAGSNPKPFAPANAAEPENTAEPAPEPANTPDQAKPGGRKLSFRERHAAEFEAGKQAITKASAPEESSVSEEFAPSDDDLALEETVLIGQRAVEKILGGVVIDERPLHGS